MVAVGAMVFAMSVAAAEPLPVTPLTQDPLGPIVDVTDQWQRYQPASSFCVQPDVFQLAGTGPTTTGDDPVCAGSGFPASRTGLVKINVESPALCAGCRRLFIDYSKIPAANGGGYFYSHGHAYFHLTSFNPGYSVEPHAHSPNIKNFTNDKLFVPDGSAQEPAISTFDTWSMFYASDTAHTIYSVSQGPYYAGSWYLNQQGVRIYGSYLDVTLSTLGPLGDPALNVIGYSAGFYSGEVTCPNSINGDTADGDGWYGGCIDRFGGSATNVDPYAA